MTMSPWLVLSCSLALALAFPARVGAQPLTPQVTALAYVEQAPLPPAPGAQVELELRSLRLARARVLRVTGVALIGIGLLTFAVITAAGSSDDHCEHSESFICFDGPALWAMTGAVIATPFLLAGTVMTARGFGIARRERRRVSVQARGAGLRLLF